MSEVNRGLHYFSEENKKQFISEIISYVQSEHNQEIGVIAAENMLNFFLETIGPVIYNQAIDDTREFFKKHLENFDFELELLKRQQ